MRVLLLGLHVGVAKPGKRSNTFFVFCILPNIGAICWCSHVFSRPIFKILVASLIFSCFLCVFCICPYDFTKFEQGWCPGVAYCPGRCRSYCPDKNVPSRCGPIARTLMRPSRGANSIARPEMRICLGGAKPIGGGGLLTRT